MPNERKELATMADIRYLLAKACAAAGGQKHWADKNGVSPAYVSDVINGRRDPGELIANKFGYTAVVMYEKLPEGD